MYGQREKSINHFPKGAVFINISPIVIEEEKLEKIARGSNCLMLQGKTWQVVQLISNVSRGDLLNVDILILLQSVRMRRFTFK